MVFVSSYRTLVGQAISLTAQRDRLEIALFEASQQLRDLSSDNGPEEEEQVFSLN